jgi:hypothetical protein
LTSSPATRSFITGEGYIASDSTSKTNNTHGNFGFNAKFNKEMTSVKGNLEYVYRVNMDVGGGNFRDVDVHVKSDDMTYLGIDVSAAPPTAVATGRFYVRYIDTLTGQDYEQLDFNGARLRATGLRKRNLPAQCHGRWIWRSY